MMPAEIDSLVNAINANFGPPFLAEGLVDCRRESDGFVLRIGPRDVHFGKDLAIKGAGTRLNEEWIVERIECEGVSEDGDDPPEDTESSDGL